jgi:hypothetical protein
MLIKLWGQAAISVLCVSAALYAARCKPKCNGMSPVQSSSYSKETALPYARALLLDRWAHRPVYIVRVIGGSAAGPVVIVVYEEIWTV